MVGELRVALMMHQVVPECEHHEIPVDIDMGRDLFDQPPGVFHQGGRDILAVSQISRYEVLQCPVAFAQDIRTLQVDEFPHEVLRQDPDEFIRKLLGIPARIRKGYGHPVAQLLRFPARLQQLIDDLAEPVFGGYAGNGHGIGDDREQVGIAEIMAKGHLLEMQLQE